MYDKDKLLEAIWQEPQRVTGLQFDYRGGKWQSRQRLDGTDSTRSDKTVLHRHTNGQIFVNYHGSSIGFQDGDIWQFLMWKHNTNDFADVLQIVGDAYGVQPDLSSFTQEQQERARRRRSERQLLRDVADIVTAALNTEDGAAARDYLNARHLQPTERLGAWNSNVRAAVRKHMTDKCGLSVRDADAYLRRFFPLWVRDFKDGNTGTWTDYADAYQLAMPYYNGSGNVIGFALRLTAQDAPTWTDDKGQVQTLPKYKYSSETPRGGGYCETLRGGGEDVYIVEGLLDAEAMKQHGFRNVLACGGMKPTDNAEDAAKSMIATLKRYRAKKLTYIPDCEYYDADDEQRGIGEAGSRKTDATRLTIAALLPYVTGRAAGDGFISVRIADLETEDSRRNHTKEDADSYLRKHGTEHMQGVLHNAAAWYEYELQTIVCEHLDDADAMAAEAVDVFCNINNPTQQQRLKDELTDATGGYLARLKEAGVTAAALSLVERDGKGSLQAARMAEVVADLGKAKTPEAIAGLLTKAQRIQHADTYADFAAQANMTREDMHRLVAAKPEYLATPWKLWTKNRRNGNYYSNRVISFAPAAVSIVAAPTNHGKTLVLLQTAIKAAQSTGQHFLYLSFENDAEQLYIRAVAAHIGGAWQGATIGTGEYAQPVENPRAILRDYIKATDCPLTLFQDDKKTRIDIGRHIEDYWRTIAPRLHLIRTQADIDAVTTNVTAYVEEMRAAGAIVGGVFIDYLQLLHYPGAHAHARTDEVKGICDRLNDLAKATRLPVVLAAQFNRDATKNTGDKLDGIELANIGESAGIENIAEDVYLVWQVDKINPKGKDYTTGDKFEVKPYQWRSRRCFQDTTDADTLRRGYLYIENMKARDYATGGYCLLPFSGEAGAILSDDSIHADE